MSGNELLKSGMVDTVNTYANRLFRALALSLSSVKLLLPTDSGGTPVLSFQRPLIKDQDFFLFVQESNN